MDLYAALGFEAYTPGEAINLAFVGAGGKTTAIFQLARQFIQRNYQKVFVTTTTHLGESEKNLADHVFVLHPSDNLEGLTHFNLEGVILICGPAEENQKIGGLSLAQIKLLWNIAEDNGIPLLVEADGSRRRPIKAPADFEPEIPDFINHVVVVAGLSALGKQLSDEYVHRPEVFAKISKQPLGSIITTKHLLEVLLSPIGGQKRIPERAGRTVLLNQSDTLKHFGEVRDLAKGLVHGFERVIIAQLGSDSHEIQAVYEPIVGIVLAAGASTRFGESKQLADWEGQPVLPYVIRKALSAGMQGLRVVLGSDRDNILKVISDMEAFKQNEFSVVVNENWHQGQSTSIRKGLDNLPNRVGGVIFMLADQPIVPVQILELLQDIRAFTRSWVVAPTYHGKRSNPVLFGRELFDDLRHLEGDIGGRSLLKEPISFPISWVPWDDPGLTLDFDTLGDYRQMIEMRSK